MYPNLRAEMARKRVTMTELAEHLHITISTLSLKMSGKSDFTLKEAIAIRSFLGVEMDLRELFREELKAV